MVRARLHIICGNCGCNDMFEWRYDPQANDMGDGTFLPGVSLACNNCSTIHDLDDNAAPEKQNEPTDLDTRMRTAGMFSVAELLAGVPLDTFRKHAGVNDLVTFNQWLEIRRTECLKMQARFELNNQENDELYEWILAHAAVFSEVHINFKAALAGNREQSNE